MPDRILTTRELNRTHLQRQHLLERSSMSTGDMLRAIVGLQAQDVKDPYLALWSHISGFAHDDLATMLLDRSAVRASLMRGTIHLVTADDYQMLFPATYPLHLRALPNLAFSKQVPKEQKVRTRIISDEFRARISTVNGLFTSTYLVDGFVSGTWKVNEGQIQLEEGTPLSRSQRREVEREAAAMAPFWTGAELPVAWVDR